MTQRFSSPRNLRNKPIPNHFERIEPTKPHKAINEKKYASSDKWDEKRPPSKNVTDRMTIARQP